MKQDKPIELTLPFTAICLDDKRKPNEIPQEKWLTEGKPYTVIGVAPSPIDGTLGFKLKEITLGPDTFPYGCFNTMRFGIPVQDKSATLEEELENLGIKVQELEEV